MLEPTLMSVGRMRRSLAWGLTVLTCLAERAENGNGNGSTLYYEHKVLAQPLDPMALQPAAATASRKSERI
jgi:hypothetical protein